MLGSVLLVKPFTIKKLNDPVNTYLQCSYLALSSFVQETFQIC